MLALSASVAQVARPILALAALEAHGQTDTITVSVRSSGSKSEAPTASAVAQVAIRILALAASGAQVADCY
jgi:hypothetical protein